MFNKIRLSVIFACEKFLVFHYRLCPPDEGRRKFGVRPLEELKFVIKPILMLLKQKDSGDLVKIIISYLKIAFGGASVTQNRKEDDDGCSAVDSE